MDKTAIEKACDAAGGQAALAAKIKVTPQAVNLWVSKGRAPTERVLDIERFTGVSRHDLRPDIYPVEATA